MNMPTGSFITGAGIADIAWWIRERGLIVTYAILREGHMTRGRALWCLFVAWVDIGNNVVRK